MSRYLQRTHGGRWGCTWWSALLVAYLLATQGPSQAQSQQQVNITTGQQLADEVAAWGVAGTDTTLTITLPFISLANVTFTSKATLASLNPGVAVFSSGMLTIEGQASGSGQPVIVDSSMRYLMAPPLSGMARTTLQGITVINSCEAKVPLPGDGINYNVAPFVLILLPPSMSYQSTTLNDVVLYGRHAAVMTNLYPPLLQRAPFPQIKELMPPNARSISNTQSVIKWMTPYSVSAAFHNLPCCMFRNVTLKSISDPDDPLLKQLRAAGKLMPPAFCNGTIMSPTDLEEVDGSRAPLFVAQDTAGLTKSLFRSLEQSATQKRIRGPPTALMLIGNSSLQSLPNLTAPLLISYHHLISGPWNDDPSYQVTGEFNLGFKQDLFTLAPGAQLFLMQLTLCGLATRPPPASLVPAGQTPLPSILPVNLLANQPTESLEALNRQPLIYMHNCTLVIPTGDYLALYILAQPNVNFCPDEETALRVAQMRPGIIEYNVKSLSLPGDGPEIVLDLFVGWGVHATLARLQPHDPITLPYCHDHDHGENSHWFRCPLSYVIIGVSSLVFVLGVMWVMVVLCSKRAAAAMAKHRQAEQPREGMALAQFSTSRHALACAVEQLKVLGSRKGRAGVCTSSVTTGTTQLITANTSIADSRASSSMMRLEGSHTPDACVTFVHVPEDKAGEEAGGSSVEGDDVEIGLAAPPLVAALIAAQSTTPLHRSRLQQAVRNAEDSCLRQVSRLQAGLRSRVGEQSEGGDGPGSDELQPGAPCEEALRKQVHQLAVGLNEEPDKLVLADVLGRGSGGTVYIGQWRGLLVAVKTVIFEEGLINSPVLPTHGITGTSTDPGTTTDMASTSRGQPAADLPAHGPMNLAGLSRPLLEAAISASVGHRNVVATYYYDVKPVEPLHGSEQDDGLQIHVPNRASMMTKAFKLFLVQELCSVTLSQCLDSGVLHDPLTKAVDLMAALCVLRDIADGLVYLHGKGIIHGDLKPANVMLKNEATSNQDVIAKLTDFGLSVTLQPGLSHVSNIASGTPFYVAPEVIVKHQLSTSSDLYSFGVIMWEVVVGHTPHTQATGAAAHTWSPDFPHYKPPHEPPITYAWLSYMCLQHEPHARPSAAVALQHIEQMISDLRAQAK